jgi:hypothetical protein
MTENVKNVDYHMTKTLQAQYSTGCFVTVISLFLD